MLARVTSAMGAEGRLCITRLSPHGFYADHIGENQVKLPSEMSWRYKIRSWWLEMKLRATLALRGVYNGLVRGEGSTMGVGRLYATVLRRSGAIEHLGLISTDLVVDAGLNFIRDDWNNNGADFTNMNFHGCGTGTTSPAAGDTALQSELTTALNPDNTRATGTRSAPASRQWRSVGTLTFDASVAVTEWGLFSQSATGGGTLFDRATFSAINVASGDSIQFTYTNTLSGS